MRKSLMLVALIIACSSNLYADSLPTPGGAVPRLGNGGGGGSDSTSMVPNPGPMPPMISYGGNIPGANLTSTSATTYTYAACPAGFTYQGSTKYPTSQQTTTTYYRNGQAVGTSTGPVTDVAADCNKTETQTVACPAGQIGSITQSRLVSTGNAGYEYGAWGTTSDTCTAPPPPTVTTQTQTLPCPAGQTGSISQYRSVSTDYLGNVTYGAWTTSSNTCTTIVNPPPPPPPPPATCANGASNPPTCTVWTGWCGVGGQAFGGGLMGIPDQPGSPPFEELAPNIWKAPPGSQATMCYSGTVNIPHYHGPVSRGTGFGQATCTGGRWQKNGTPTIAPVNAC